MKSHNDPLRQGLQLKQIDKLLFTGEPNQWPNKHVFGGHVAAQALGAALATVEPNLKVHSMHAYFLRPGKYDRPIVYDVDPIRNGRSFSTRRVVAIQDGEAIFNTSISFHVQEEGVEHQTDMGEIPHPDTLTDDFEYMIEMMRKAGKDITKILPLIPFDMRSITRVNPFDPKPLDPIGGYWMKLKEPLDLDAGEQAKLLCYASDFGLIGACLRPHGMLPRDPRIKLMTSLDHCFYLHDDNFDVNDWIYYRTEGLWAGKGRMLGRGTFYTQDGNMIASSTQEGLLRLKPEE